MANLTPKPGVSLTQDGPAIVTVYEWTGAANDGDMQNPLNWKPNGVPRTVDEVRCMVIPRPPVGYFFGSERQQ